MSRLLRANLLAFAVWGIVANCAHAQSVAVENHWVPSLANTDNTLGSFERINIPGSSKTITIPAGTAVITWIASTGFESTGRVRPIVGNDAPTQGLPVVGDGSYGSWSTVTTGGEMTVKLEYQAGQSGQLFSTDTLDSLAWTLVVYPPSSAPAVGFYGLLLTTIGLATAGVYVMKRRHNALIAAVGMALVLGTLRDAMADTWNVPNDAPTIQIAISKAASGDTIIVEPGTYLESIGYDGKSLTIQSIDPLDADVVAGTIIDAGGLGTVVTFTGPSTFDASLNGFTVRGGTRGIDGKNTTASVGRCPRSR